MSPDTQSTSPTPLPTNRSVLEQMFKHCDICIGRVLNAIHRNHQIVQLLWDFEAGQIIWDECTSRLQHIKEVAHRERDTSTVEHEALWPYCDRELMTEAAKYNSKGGLAVAGMDTVKDQESGNKFAESGAYLVLGQRLYVTALQRLRLQLLAALDANSADTGADTEAFLAKIAPRNSDVATLHLRLIREKKSGKSQNQIALEFTDGDKARAASLLKGVRRYRKRLSQRDA